MRLESGGIFCWKVVFVRRGAKGGARRRALKLRLEPLVPEQLSQEPFCLLYILLSLSLSLIANLLFRTSAKFAASSIIWRLLLVFSGASGA